VFVVSDATSEGALLMRCGVVWSCLAFSSSSGWIRIGSRPELLSKVDAKFEKSGAPLRNIRSLMRVGMSMWKPKFKLLAK